MRIALLGGNGYQYANAPSYVRANGRGVITQRDLFGADATAIAVTYTPAMAYADAKALRAAGEPVPANVQALADQHEKDRRYDVFSTITGLAEKGLAFGEKIVGGKQQSGDSNAGRSTDNTALIIIGGVGAVAVISVLMATGKKKRRR